jgi:hypothetical protein
MTPLPHASPLLRPLRHLYLIHDEDNAANLTPALDPQLSPELIVIAFDATRWAEAEALSRVLRGYQLKVELLSLKDELNINATQTALSDALNDALSDALSDALKEQHKQLTTDQRARPAWGLNLSGGSKALAATAQQLFMERGWPVFYVDSSNAHLHWIWHPAMSEPAHPCQEELLKGRDLANRLTLKPFFESYRAHVLSMRAEPPHDLERLALCDELAARPERYEHALATLNYLASMAHKDLLTEPLSKAQRADERLMWLVERLEGLGLVRRKRKGLQFTSEEARFFANGGWLEELTHQVVRELRALHPSIQDHARGVELMWRREGEELLNELDVVFLSNNQLFIIECKTKRFEGKRSTQAAEVIYKLDSLQELLGGVSTHAMLVSYGEIRESDLKRARALKVSTCTGKELKSLRQHLLGWVSAPQKRR